MKNINKIFLLLAININAMKEERLFNKNNEVYEESENNKEISDIFYKNINYRYNIPKEEIPNKIPKKIKKLHKKNKPTLYGTKETLILIEGFLENLNKIDIKNESPYDFAKLIYNNNEFASIKRVILKRYSDFILKRDKKMNNILLKTENKKLPIKNKFDNYICKKYYENIEEKTSGKKKRRESQKLSLTEIYSKYEKLIEILSTYIKNNLDNILKNFIPKIEGKKYQKKENYNIVTGVLKDIHKEHYSTEDENNFIKNLYSLTNKKIYNYYLRNKQSKEKKQLLTDHINNSIIENYLDDNFLNEENLIESIENESVGKKNPIKKLSLIEIYEKYKNLRKILSTYIKNNVNNILKNFIPKIKGKKYQKKENYNIVTGVLKDIHKEHYSTEDKNNFIKNLYFLTNKKIYNYYRINKQLLIEPINNSIIEDHLGGNFLNEENLIEKENFLDYDNVYNKTDLTLNNLPIKLKEDSIYYESSEEESLSKEKTIKKSKKLSLTEIYAKYKNLREILSEYIKNNLDNILKNFIPKIEGKKYKNNNNTIIGILKDIHKEHYSTEDENNFIETLHPLTYKRVYNFYDKNKQSKEKKELLTNPINVTKKSIIEDYLDKNFHEIKNSFKEDNNITIKNLLQHLTEINKEIFTENLETTFNKFKKIVLDKKNNILLAEQYHLNKKIIHEYIDKDSVNILTSYKIDKEYTINNISKILNEEHFHEDINEPMIILKKMINEKIKNIDTINKIETNYVIKEDSL